MTRLFSFLLGFTLLVSVFGQVPDRFSTLDGLPSNEVYNVSQSQNGTIWIATDRGAVKYDGASFHLIDKSEGLSSTCIFDVYHSQKSDEIWFRGLNGVVSLQFDETILSKQFNSINYRWNEMGFLKVEGSKAFAFGCQNFEITKFEIDSELNLHSEPYLFSKSEIETLINQKLSVSGYNPKWEISKIDTLENIIVVKDKIVGSYIIGNLTRGQVKSGFCSGLYLNKSNRFILQIEDLLIVVEGNKVEIREVEPIKCLATDHVLNGLYVGFQGLSGLHYFSLDSLSASPRIIHKNINVNSILLDQERNLWYATKNGLFLNRAPEIQNVTYQFDMPQLPVYRLEIQESEKSVVFIGSDEIAYAITKNQPPRKMHTSRFGFGIYVSDSIYFSPLDYTWPQQNFFWWNPKNNTQLWTPVSMPSSGGVGIVKSITRYKNHIWLAGSTGLGYIKDGKLELISSFEKQRITIIKDINDTLYVGGDFGLMTLVFDPNQKLIWNKSFLTRKYISDITRFNGQVFVTTFDEGLFSGNVTENFKSVDLPTESNVFTSLENVGDSLLWIGHNTGVLLLDPAKRATINYGPNVGIRTGYTYDVSSLDNQIWLATEMGVVKFNPGQINLDTNKFHLNIKKLKIEGQDFAPSEIHKFKGEVENLFVELNALFFKSPKNILFQYRIQEFEDKWTDMESNELLIKSLQQGNYTLEFRATTDGKVRSINCPRINVSVIPIWWQVTWVQNLGIIIVILGAFVVLFQRQKRRSESKLLLAKIGEYRHQALAAQLNPHFIFNCLNSIQSYILSNNSKAAASYLSKFASLMRQMLNHAAKRNITLEEEIETIEKYCELEKLRLKNKFSFHMEIDPGINLEKIKVPGLIFQPFIENAIIHGVQPKQGNGSVELRIVRTEGGILCSIADDGVGRNISEKKDSKITQHPSFGGSIAKQRIDLGNSPNQKLELRIEDKFSEDGTPCGTVVFINIYTA